MKMKINKTNRNSTNSYKIMRAGDSYVIMNSNMMREPLTVGKVKSISKEAVTLKNPITIHTVGLSRAQVGQIGSEFQRIGEVSAKVYQIIPGKKISNPSYDYKIVIDG